MMDIIYRAVIPLIVGGLTDNNNVVVGMGVILVG
jgi:hypothetical protein